MAANMRKRTSYDFDSRMMEPCSIELLDIDYRERVRVGIFSSHICIQFMFYVRNIDINEFYLCFYQFRSLRLKSRS